LVLDILQQRRGRTDGITLAGDGFGGGIQHSIGRLDSPPLREHKDHKSHCVRNSDCEPRVTQTSP
jgi:hypothetical protein